jgi:hypothetical protein
MHQLIDKHGNLQNPFYLRGKMIKKQPLPMNYTENAASPGGPGDTAATLMTTNEHNTKFISSPLQQTCCISS